MTPSTAEDTRLPREGDNFYHDFHGDKAFIEGILQREREHEKVVERLETRGFLLPRGPKTSSSGIILSDTCECCGKPKPFDVPSGLILLP